jgi:hypothetical protein
LKRDPSKPLDKTDNGGSLFLDYANYRNKAYSKEEYMKYLISLRESSEKIV